MGRPGFHRWETTHTIQLNHGFMALAAAATCGKATRIVILNHVFMALVAATTFGVEIECDHHERACRDMAGRSIDVVLPIAKII
jgi:hypothetical protein